MMVDEFTTDMRSVRVTVFTGKISFNGRDRNAPTGDHMVAGLMTVLTPEVHSTATDTHVNIMMFFRLCQYRTHVPVFDRITPATPKMTVDAAGGSAGSSDIFRNAD